MEQQRYKINVEGRNFTLTGPAGMTKEQVWGAFKANRETSRNDALDSVDYDAEPDVVRQSIKSLPDEYRSKALRRWADKVVAKERSVPFWSPRGIAQAADNTARTLSRGTLVGSFLDEANAGVNSALNTVSGGYLGAPYDETLAYNRARDRAIDKDYPLASVGGQLVGGVASALPIMALSASTLPGRMAVGAGIAPVHSTIATWGNNEGGDGNVWEQASNRFENVGENAKWAAGLGAAFPVAGTAVSRLAKPVLDSINDLVPVARQYLPSSKVLGSNSTDDVADQVIANRIRASGKTPQEISRDLSQGRQSANLSRGLSDADARMGSGTNNQTAGLPETIADTSDGMRRLTGSTYRTGGEAGDFVQETLENRHRGPQSLYEKPPSDLPASERGHFTNITEGFSRALGLSSKGSARTTVKSIEDKMKKDAGPKYEDAYNNSESFDLQGVLDKASQLVMDDPGQVGRSLSSAMELFVNKAPYRYPINNIRRFDAAKKNLDDMIGNTKPGSNERRVLTGFRSDLMKAVHTAPDGSDINKTYREARGIWEDGAKNKEAIDLGRAALIEDSEISVEIYRGLNKAQKQLFRLGLIDSLRQRLRRTRTGSDILGIFNERNTIELLREVMNTSGDGLRNDMSKRFSDFIRRQARMVQTRNKSLFNSETATRQGDDVQLAANSLSQVWNRFKSNGEPLSAAWSAIGLGFERVLGYRQDVALAVAKRLLEADPATQRRYLAQLQAKFGPDKLQEFTRYADELTHEGSKVISRQLSSPNEVEAFP